MMRVYITKYALSDGIMEVEATETSQPNMICYTCNGSYPQFFHKGDWYNNKEDANKQAETMRVKRIVSLEKQIAKLKKLKF